ncbi:MAG: alpha/beta hydrolase [Candidatus Nanopelagicales bacterium]|nr:alpha/beta hydrolase [Candidatus Nanopelagicales bacterium]
MSEFTDVEQFETHIASPRGFGQAYVREGVGGMPLVCVHGWPYTKYLYWKAIQPLVDAGFEVIVPDLRGFGESDFAPDGFYDGPSHAKDLYSLVHDELGHESVVLMGGDLGGSVIQEIAARYPDWVDRMVLFNSPLPYLKSEMAGITGTRTAPENLDYYERQGKDPDGLANELDTAELRRQYIAEFFTTRNWAHPGAYSAEEVAFHTQPFGDADRLRASFNIYVAVYDETKRSEAAIRGKNERTKTLILFGPSDQVMYPAFDLMAQVVFPNHVGPIVLEECGHFVPWEAPEELVRTTVAFCDDLLM